MSVQNDHRISRSQSEARDNTHAWEEPAAKAFFATIVCCSLPSFGTMACLSVASRYRPTAVPCMTGRSDGQGTSKRGQQD